MKLVNANKGIFAFETRISGRAAHSSAPDAGANAVFAAARCIEFLRVLADELRVADSADDRFDPPFTTVNVGLIEGGVALNVIPEECRFVWEFRPVPGQDAPALLKRFEAFVEREALPELRRGAADASIETRRLAAVPPLKPEDGSPAEALVTRLTGDNAPSTASFATEAGLFQQRDIPTVICGPGDIAQAHQPNEFVALEQIDRCLEFLTNVTEWMANRR